MRRLSLLILAGAIWGGASPAAPLPRDGTLIYSSLCFEQGSGDPAGYLLKIDRTANGDSLYFEWSEGGLMGAIAETVSLNPETGALEFTILPEGWPEDQQPVYRYRGIISDKKVTLDQVDWGDGKGFEDVRSALRTTLRSAKANKNLPTCK